MSEVFEDETLPVPGLNDVPQERPCLRCGTAFWSEGLRF